MQLLAFFVLLIASFTGHAADYAAQITALTGEATATSQQNTTRPLNLNDKVYSGETISTDKDSKVSLIFSDGAKFDLSENTRFEISQYQYDNTKATDNFTSRVLKGTFRFVSGLIATNKPSAMAVNSPVATIGIRGTHVVAEVSHNYAKIILLEPESPKSTAIEVSNQFGSVIVDKPGYGTEVPDEFSPPSPVRRMQLRTVDNLMRSIQNTQRIRTPRF